MVGKLTPFEVVDNINSKSGELEADVVGYDAYMTNRIFSNIKETVLFANEMNLRWGNLTKQQQYDFYYHSLAKKKRFGKWHKNQDDTAALSIISEAYGLSRRKAKDVLELLRPRLDEIKQELFKGGRNAK